MTCMMAISFLSPFSMRASTSFLNFFSVSARIELTAIMALAQLALEPTARNSNLLPVKAKGEVLLRSVLSSSSSGMLLCRSSFRMASSCSSNLSPTLSFTSARTLLRHSPMKTEMMAGGASVASTRQSLPAPAHEAINSFRDAAEVVVFQLLAFGRSMTEYCPSAHHEVRTGVEQAFVYYEILLFTAEGCRYFAYVLIKIMANVNSSFIQGRQRLQQGSFVVQGFSRIRNKNSWDTKGFAGSDLHNESRRRRVPGCVTAGFESRAQATTWKGRGIRFLLDQGGAVKFFDGGTITLYRKEGIMLFSGGASQRLEPMGEVSNTFCLSPLT